MKLIIVITILIIIIMLVSNHRCMFWTLLRIIRQNTLNIGNIDKVILPWDSVILRQHDASTHSFHSSTSNLLNKRPPEQFARAFFILAREEICSGLNELVQTQLTVAVRVDGLERIGSHLRIESENLEEE